jgi:hypothetical protein
MPTGIEKALSGNLYRLLMSQIIKLEISHMSLWGQTTSDKAPCSDKDDRLVIEEPSGGVKPYCVSASSKTITTKSNQLTIRFITNGLGDAQGFRAFYTAGINIATYCFEHNPYPRVGAATLGATVVKCR